MIAKSRIPVLKEEKQICRVHLKRAIVKQEVTKRMILQKGLKRTQPRKALMQCDHFKVHGL